MIGRSATNRPLDFPNYESRPTYWHCFKLSGHTHFPLCGPPPSPCSGLGKRQPLPAMKPNFPERVFRAVRSKGGKWTSPFHRP